MSRAARAAVYVRHRVGNHGAAQGYPAHLARRGVDRRDRRVVAAPDTARRCARQGDGARQAHEATARDGGRRAGGRPFRAEGQGTGVGIAGVGVAAQHDGVAPAKVLVVFTARCAVLVGIAGVAALTNRRHLFLNTHFPARNRVVEDFIQHPFDHDPERFGGGGLRNARYGIVLHHDAFRKIDPVAAIAQVRAAVNDNPRPVAVAVGGSGRASVERHAVVFYHRAAIARGSPVGIGVVEQHLKTAVIGQGVVGDAVGSGPAFQAHRTDAVVAVVAHDVARDGYARGGAVLELNSAAGIIGDGIVHERNVGFVPVPDHHPPRKSARVARGPRVTDRHAAHRPVGVKARPTHVIEDRYVVHQQVVVAQGRVNARLGVGISTGEVFHRQLFNRHVRDATVDGDPTAGARDRRPVDDGFKAVNALERQRFVDHHALGEGCFGQFDHIAGVGGGNGRGDGRKLGVLGQVGDGIKIEDPPHRRIVGFVKQRPFEGGPFRRRHGLGQF